MSIKTSFDEKLNYYREKILQKCTLSANNVCLLWQGYCRASKRGGTVYGEMTVTLPGKKKTKMSVSRLVFLSGSPDIPPGYQVSHLCHHSTCCYVGHLVAEPSAVNKHRQRCNRHKICLGHKGRPDCIFFKN